MAGLVTIAVSSDIRHTEPSGGVRYDLDNRWTQWRWLFLHWPQLGYVTKIAPVHRYALRARPDHRDVCQLLVGRYRRGLTGCGRGQRLALDRDPITVVGGTHRQRLACGVIGCLNQRPATQPSGAQGRCPYQLRRRDAKRRQLEH